MHYVQFIWLVLPISFQLDVQIGCIFYGFKSQVEFYYFSNLNICIYANISNTCSTIYLYINMHKYYKSFLKVKNMISIFKKSNINYIIVSITYLYHLSPLPSQPKLKCWGHWVDAAPSHWLHAIFISRTINYLFGLGEWQGNKFGDIVTSPIN
jgi:hypothetical protein